jgi:low temperature requirement protein LtrA
LPWITSPLDGIDLDDIAFHQRHEANPVELFFDLIFVANLATFTAYHGIVDVDSLNSYVIFFTILWSTWFQTTLFDVRFTRDSVWERLCKIIQLVVFVLFAYTGPSFNIAENEGDPLVRMVA